MKNNKELLFALLSLVIGMILLSFAAVPIYNIFCKATGYGGTTQKFSDNKSYKMHNKIGNRNITVNFDSNLDPKLDFYFKPEQRYIVIKPGENAIVFYKLKNLSDKDIYATALYNVTPNKVGKFFYKIQCFCFEEQLIKAHEEQILPVSFYIDPLLEDDVTLKEVNEITLSYIFYKLEK
jgi:cytochrome c oxidase assembly protein subunit 11